LGSTEPAAIGKAKENLAKIEDMATAEKETWGMKTKKNGEPI
jgi:hypothetical protein